MIKRESYMSRIRPFIGNDLVKVLTGIRRSGKSVMLDLIKEELCASGVDSHQFISINFENISNAHLRTAVALHDEIIRRASEIKGIVYLFFDEIQEVKTWEKCINSFRLELDCDIYVTSSYAGLLSSNSATYLTGRYVEFTIYPFSFAEFIELYRTVFQDTDIRTCFSKYLTLGGMPSLSNLRYDEAAGNQYLEDLSGSIELKDIVRPNQIRNVGLLEWIIAYITSNIDSTFSSTSVSKYLKSEGRNVSPETVSSYIKACTDAFLFYQVKRQDLQSRRILTTNEKYYIADHGIGKAMLGDNINQINPVLKNIVYMELLRRGYTVTVGRAGNREIDFVCEKQGNRLYIQVAYLLDSEETIEREFGVYDRIHDNFPKYVVTMDELDMSRNGIKHRNIRDFLLQNEWD